MSIRNALTPSLVKRCARLLIAASLFFFFFSVSAVQAQDGLNEAKELLKEKKYDEAESKFSSLLASLGPDDSLAIAECHQHLGSIYLVKRQLEKCIEENQKAIRYFPPGHRKQGDCYFKMGGAYIRLYDYANYLDVNKRAAEIYANSVGKDDIRYTRALNSLGWAYQLTGSYKESERTLVEARRIKERNNVYDIQYGKILNQLSRTYTVLNKFQEAEECITISLKVKEGKSGKNADYAKTQAYYAGLLKAIGRFDDAFVQIEEAIAIATNSGRESDVLAYKQVKATLLVVTEQYEAAAALYEEIRKERSNNEGDSNYAKTLYDLANIYLDLGQLDKAREHAEMAVSLFENIHGNKHPYYALAIRQKADILLEKGQIGGIENLYKTSSQIIARRYSRNHIEYFKSEYSYFLYLKKTGDYSRALDKIEKIDRVITRHIVNASKYLSIQELIEVTSLYHEYFQEILDLTSLNPDNEVLTAKALDCSLFYKGYVLEAMLRVKKAIRQSREITELSERLTELRVQLNSELDMSEHNNQQISSLQDEIGNVEIEIARSLGNLRKAEDRMSWDALQFELGQDEATVDFVRFKGETDDENQYAAIILRPDVEAPIFVRLFQEADITRFFEEEVSNSAVLIARLYEAQERGIKPKETAEQISLYELIWKPIAPHLDGIQTVYYVCDGILHNIALHAIPTDLETVVSDSINLLQMTSFRNLMRGRAGKFMDAADNALIIGGLKYGEAKEPGEGNRGSWQQWTDLRFAGREVTEIAGMLKEQDKPHELLTGEVPVKRVVQDKLRDADQLRILHFATHGFFSTQNLLGVKSKVKVNQTNLELAQSGLVLANANTLGREEALLSAYEISELDLNNTELVVLSACETGLGQVYEYEGVYGLQRAFKIAGAEYIIMSLWQVSDYETKAFMTEFYKNYLNNNSTIPEAFYQTQREMKERFFDPVRWAGFVLPKMMIYHENDFYYPDCLFAFRRRNKGPM